MKKLLSTLLAALAVCTMFSSTAMAAETKATAKPKTENVTLVKGGNEYHFGKASIISQKTLKTEQREFEWISTVNPNMPKGELIKETWEIKSLPLGSVMSYKSEDMKKYGTYAVVLLNTIDPKNPKAIPKEWGEAKLTGKSCVLSLPEGIKPEEAILHFIVRGNNPDSKRYFPIIGSPYIQLVDDEKAISQESRDNTKAEKLEFKKTAK